MVKCDRCGMIIARVVIDNTNVPAPTSDVRVTLADDFEIAVGSVATPPLAQPLR